MVRRRPHRRRRRHHFRRTRRRVARIFHVAHGTPYHVEDSEQGIRHAHATGQRIDLDLQIDADGVEQVTHWPRPLLHDGFYDPEGKIGRLRTIASMSTAEVARLRTRDGYRILTLDEALALCGQLQVSPVLEPKGDKRFRVQARWTRIKKVADANGVHGLSAYALRANRAALPYVKAAGIPEHVLSH